MGIKDIFFKPKRKWKGNRFFSHRLFACFKPHNNHSNRKLKSTVLYPTFCLLRMFLQDFLKVEDRRQGIYIWPTTLGACVGWPGLSLV